MSLPHKLFEIDQVEKSFKLDLSISAGFNIQKKLSISECSAHWANTWKRGNCCVATLIRFLRTFLIFRDTIYIVELPQNELNKRILTVNT